MATFNVAEAKSRFSELVQKAMIGEEVIIAKDNKPVVKLVRIAEPGTNPPPQTRSSSAIPVFRRGGSMLGPVNPTKPSGRPPRLSDPRLACPPGTSSRGSSSIRLFQAPQPSQRPVHLAWVAPHCWQTKRACCRAIAVNPIAPEGRSRRTDLHLDRPLGPAVDELVDKRVARAINLFGRPVPDNAAAVQHRDAIGDLARAHQVVSD